MIKIIGQKTIALASNIGDFTIFFFLVIKGLFSTNTWKLKQIVDQVINMFIKSMPLISLTAVFTGAVLALQSYIGFSRMHAESSIASVVVISIARELGPVLTGLMFAGRLGASIAAEIGTMRVTDQIDALDVLGIESKSYLILPRIVAAMISLPLLVLCADILGVFGGYLVATQSLGFDSTNYLLKTVSFIKMNDILSGIVKAFFFGIAITSISCYMGYKTSGGAQGVGKATTKGVVTSSITILALNYIITTLIFRG